MNWSASNNIQHSNLTELVICRHCHAEHTSNTCQGCGVGVARCRRFLGGVGVGFLTTLGVWFFWPTSEIHLDNFLYPTPKLGIFVEMVQFLMKLLLIQIILAVYHDFHRVLDATKLLTAELHSLYVKESESEILNRSESDILPPTPQLWYLQLKTNSKNVCILALQSIYLSLYPSSPEKVTLAILAKNITRHNSPVDRGGEMFKPSKAAESLAVSIKSIEKFWIWVFWELRHNWGKFRGVWMTSSGPWPQQQEAIFCLFPFKNS